MDNKDLVHEPMVEEFWQQYFTEGPPIEKVRRNRFYRFLPAENRCKWCLAPFDGVSGAIAKNFFQTYPSRYNPHYCNVCDDFSNKYQGGLRSRSQYSSPIYAVPASWPKISDPKNSVN